MNYKLYIYNNKLYYIKIKIQYKMRWLINLSLIFLKKSVKNGNDHN